MIKYFSCKYLGAIFALFFSTAMALANDCVLPPGVKVDGEYLRGLVTVNIGNSQTAKFNLFVQNIRYPDERCAAQVYKASALLWKSLYNDYINRGMTPDNIKTLVNSISGKPNSGVYIRTDLNACGYSGRPRTIYCGPSADPTQKYFMAHENMHGWQFTKFVENRNDGIAYFKIFVYFSNLVYDAYKHNPTSLQGDNWSLFDKPMNQREVDWVYGMQNQDEWGAEIFSDWLYDTASASVWPYIKAEQSFFVRYFHCLWQTDNTMPACARIINSPIEFADNDPRINAPARVRSVVTIDGQDQTISFTKRQSLAIWKVCFGNLNGTTKEADSVILNRIITKIAPALPSNPAKYYRLGYADANHDGVLDWICRYDGPGPHHQDYLWNKKNKQGTYTFLVSGKLGDSYAEYKQDPFLRLPTINGSLAQPQFREWQGQFNSAFGANVFSNNPKDSWFKIFVQHIQ